MTSDWPIPLEGGCGCNALRYRLERTPLFVHCCNCQQCQRETGSAFALNVIVEADKVTLLPSAIAGDTSGRVVPPKMVLMPSASGSGQLIARCPYCNVAVWSFYIGAGPYVKFVRGGTLDKHGADGKSAEYALRPDMFIYTKFKQPWVVYPNDAKAKKAVAEELYDLASKWPKEALERWKAVTPRTEEWRKRGSKWEEVGDIFDCRIAPICGTIYGQQDQESWTG